MDAFSALPKRKISSLLLCKTTGRSFPHEFPSLLKNQNSMPTFWSTQTWWLFSFIAISADLKQRQRQFIDDALTENMGQFRCNICPKSYARQDGLESHIRVIHEGDRFKCDNCDLKLTTQQGLKKHVIAVHTDKASIFRYCFGVKLI